MKIIGFAKDIDDGIWRAIFQIGATKTLTKVRSDNMRNLYIYNLQGEKQMLTEDEKKQIFQ